jgi:hypothetical protein
MVNSEFLDPRLELGMKFKETNPPRTYRIGAQNQVEIADWGRLHLNPDDQITMTTERGAEYDIARKDWGFYATPSVNGRLKDFGLRTALIKNRGTGRYFVLLVEVGEEAAYEEYCAIENLQTIAWLDDEETLARIENKLSDDDN